MARVLVERAGLDITEARILASASGGSVSRALAGARGDLEADRDAAFGLLDAARARSVGARLKAAGALAQHGTKRRDRDAIGARLTMVQSLLRDLTVIGSGAGASVLSNGDLESELRGLASAFDAARLSAAYAAVTRAQQDLERSANPKLVADWVSVNV